MELTSPMPAFDRPPVMEVLCGVRFAPLEKLLSPHLGLLWGRFRSDFVTCEEHPPLGFPEPSADVSGFQFSVLDKPPLPRVWFVHKDANSVIQVQRDAFLHNWRKSVLETDYPHYDKIIVAFKKHFAEFQSFVDEEGIGPLNLGPCELKYVNHIDMATAPIGTSFPDFVWRENEGRFLPKPANVTLKFAFPLPDNKGHLHATIRKAKRIIDQRDVLVFELTAIGKSGGADEKQFWAWYDLAHEWIVRGFTDLTAPEVQSTLWKRTV